MLLDYIYLLPNFDASFFNDAKTEKSEFIFPINEQITANIADVFQTLLNSKSHFCLYIPSELTRGRDTFFKEETFRNIIRLLFLPNYLRIEHDIVFFTEKVSSENKSFDDLKNDFYVELGRQGINEFIVESLRLEQSSQDESVDFMSIYDDNLNKYLSGIQGERFQAIIDSCAFTQHFHKKWIVPVANKNDFHDKVKLIEKFEKWLWDMHPFSAKLIAMDRLARQDNAKLKSDNAILKFKLDSSSEALKLIREESANYISEVSRLRNEVSDLYQRPHDGTVGTNKELIEQLQTKIDEERNRADKILEWYKQEYEILPGWYKKFGHIIKVITGKKTFKSLFK